MDACKIVAFVRHTDTEGSPSKAAHARGRTLNCTSSQSAIRRHTYNLDDRNALLNMTFAVSKTQQHIIARGISSSGSARCTLGAVNTAPYSLWCEKTSRRCAFSGTLGCMNEAADHGRNLQGIYCCPQFLPAQEGSRYR